MAISIDHAAATEILFSESAAAGAGDLPKVADEWRERVNELGRLCPHRKSSTVIAALGTAILAKATDDRVDVYSLLDRGEAETSYSARSLADNVWARNRAKLEVDLGANGTNPLNNTPFIGKTRIDEITGVRNQEGWNIFIRCMEALRAVPDSKKAKLALRGFIAARRRVLLAEVDLDPRLGDNLTMHALESRIREYTEGDSEGGRRVQACVAGMLDAVFGVDRVVAGVINDPDRRAPLDVAVKNEHGSFHVAYEVKDKPITDAHIRASVEKTMSSHGTRNLAFLAMSRRQKQTEFTDVMQWAAQRGVKITIILDWSTFLVACRCFAPVSNDVFEGRAFRYIIARARELGVRPEPLELLIKGAME
ncbi:MAG: restriction endonuclease, SacI family [Planctomycetaceae bacterium]